MPSADPGAGNVLKITRTLRASRERVFEAWTDPEQLRHWWGPDGFVSPTVEVDLRVGGQYRIAMKPPEGPLMYLTGKYREVRPPVRLAYTWSWEHDPDRRETLVTVDLHDIDGDTEVVVTHTGFRDAKDRSDHLIGWNGSLDRLATVLKAGDDPSHDKSRRERHGRS